MELRYAKALVTGGSSGIGLETARMLRERGARVAISARGEDRLTKAAEEIKASAIPADVSDEEQVVRMVNRAIDLLGGLNVLINNAGFGAFAPLQELTLEKMEDVFRTNVFGAAMVAREATKHFVQQDYGNIINIGSTAAYKGFPGGSAYVGSKFALSGLTECWRAELRKHNIRVMQINPSEVQTGFAKTAGHEQQLSERKLRSEEIGHAIISLLEMDDRGFVTDLAVWATNPD
ncbi:MAG: SDR family oxidoreductase [Thermoanaerobaculia bacterium]|nr:SDR family oxidoreductase [Thermoanaerobaculia bacterium]